MVESAGARRARGPELLQARFGQRLRELLPGGDLVLSQQVLARGDGARPRAAPGRMIWSRAGQVLEFAMRVELTPSLETVQALPELDMVQQPVQVLLAPRLSVRSCLRLERKGWSYCAADGPLLIQHHDPLVAIRVMTARSTADDVRAARTAAAAAARGAERDGARPLGGPR